MAYTSLSEKLFLIGLLLLSSCGPRQAYLGPTLPKEKLSTVTFWNRGDIKLSALMVDGYDQLLGIGISVPAGEHEARVHVETKSSRCPSQYTEYCGEQVYYGECRAKFIAHPPQEVRVEVRGYGEVVSISVLSENGTSLSTEEKCRLYDSAIRFPRR